LETTPRYRRSVEPQLAEDRRLVDSARSAAEVIGGNQSGTAGGNPARSEPAPPGHAPNPRRPDFQAHLEAEIPFLRRAGRRWVRQPADLDDLVQDTLVQALASAHLWQPGTDLRGSLYTIMRNRFLAGVARTARSAAALEVIAAAEPGPGAPASELRLLLRDLAAAVRRLPSNQRSAVMLIGVESKSYVEAAQLMSTSVGAVRSHLARGRDRLRTAVRGSDARSPFLSRTGPVSVAHSARGRTSP
jgi:RNA polymerase sigma-70 factor (ECF subfamily)